MDDLRQDQAPHEVEQVLTHLLGRAHLFDDPQAYEAGVRETFELVTAAGVATPAPSSLGVSA